MLGVACSNTKYSSYTGSTFRKHKELISYNYAVWISIYALFLPSFFAVMVQAVAVLGSVIGTGRLPKITGDYSVAYPLKFIYILLAVLTH